MDGYRATRFKIVDAAFILWVYSVHELRLPFSPFVRVLHKRYQHRHEYGNVTVKPFSQHFCFSLRYSTIYLGFNCNRKAILSWDIVGFCVGELQAK